MVVVAIFVSIASLKSKKMSALFGITSPSAMSVFGFILYAIKP